MKGRTTELARIGEKSLVMWEHEGGRKEYVVCSFYDGNKPIGSQWSWGHYFTDIFGAVDYISVNAYK